MKHAFQRKAARVERLGRDHICVNLKTARARGLQVSAALLLRADEVIE